MAEQAKVFAEGVCLGDCFGPTSKDLLKGKYVKCTDFFRGDS